MFNETFNAVDNFFNGNQEAPDINGAALTLLNHVTEYNNMFVVVKYPSWKTVNIEHTKTNFGHSTTVVYTITKEHAEELAKFYSTIAKSLG